MDFFIDRLKEADAKVSATIIGGMFTVFTAIAAVIVTQGKIQKREIQEAHRAKKVELYKDFIDVVTRMMAGENKQVSQKALTEQELIDYLLKFKSEIALWGSPGVLLAQAKFEANSGGDVKLMFEAVDDLYREFRKDIGMSNKGLPPLHFIKANLSDPGELDEFLENQNESGE